ncbi:unnamed protein product [Peniophora sp. CBMAI 1063]|nr:unnamed protein product [Peniophora sp. CBMAI 1063]
MCQPLPTDHRALPPTARFCVICIPDCAASTDRAPPPTHFCVANPDRAASTDRALSVTRFCDVKLVVPSSNRAVFSALECPRVLSSRNKRGSSFDDLPPDELGPATQYLRFMLCTTVLTRVFGVDVAVDRALRVARRAWGNLPTDEQMSFYAFVTAHFLPLSLLPGGVEEGTLNGAIPLFLSSSSLDAPVYTSLNAEWPFYHIVDVIAPDGPQFLRPIPSTLFVPFGTRSHQRCRQVLERINPMPLWFIKENGLLGVPITGMDRCMQLLRGRDELRLNSQSKPITTLKIKFAWPNYVSAERQIRAWPNAPLNNLTKLAELTAGAVRKFMTDAGIGTINMVNQTLAHQPWRIGTGAGEIKTVDVLLLGVIFVSDGAAMPLLAPRVKKSRTRLDLVWSLSSSLTSTALLTTVARLLANTSSYHAAIGTGLTLRAYCSLIVSGFCEDLCVTYDYITTMPGPSQPYSHPGPSTGYYPPPYAYPPPMNMNGMYGYPYPMPPGPGPMPGSPRTRGGPYQPGEPSRPPPFFPAHLYMNHPPPPSHSPQPMHPHAHQPHPLHQQPKFPPHPPPGPPQFAQAYSHPVPFHPHPQNWHQGAPISPLPKQLAMPPPPALTPTSGAPPRPRIFDGPLEPEQQQQQQQLSQPQQPPVQSVPESPQPNPEPQEVQAGPSEPPPPPDPTPPPEPPHEESSTITVEQETPEEEVTIVATIEPEEAPAEVPQTGTAMHTDNPLFMIWSRRPTNPALAPGVIISPRARPDAVTRFRASSARTPPASPVLKPVALPPRTAHSSVGMLIGQEDEPEEAPEPPAETKAEKETSPEVVSTDVSTAPDTPMPGSPLSSNTSVSVAKAAEPAPPTIAEEPAPASSPAAAPASPAAPAAPAAPVAPAPKKSWASLLRSSGPTPGLPSSSVVGFSIPASPPPARVPPAQREAFLRLLSGKQHPPSMGLLPVIRPRGLVNTGNMCFANAVLQLLAYCVPFAKLFEAVGKALPPAEEGKRSRNVTEGATPLVDATVRFLKEFGPLEKKKDGRERDEEEEDGIDSFLPAYVYDAMKEKKRFESMLGQHQEDAEEFFGFFLDTLEEELAALSQSLSPPKSTSTPHIVEKTSTAPPPSEEDAGWMNVGKKNRTVVTRTVRGAAPESALTRIFGGKFMSTLRVPGQKDSAVKEDWRALQLDISRDNVHTIKDALINVAQPQPVQLIKSGVPIDGTQQVLIDSLPPVLVLHLKRFHYDTTLRTIVKLSKSVTFPPSLEIPLELLYPSAQRKTMPRTYKLFGALYHHGVSASGGHYTLDVLHPNRDGVVGGAGARPREAWVRIDDELVSDVRAEDVFGDAREDRCAYLLFYRLVGRT